MILFVVCCSVFFLRLRRPTRSMRTDTSFPTRRSADRCNIRAMAKTPSKRGSGRGKTGTGSGKPATKPDDTRKDTGRKAAGKKAGGKKLPGWMPDAPPAGKPSRRDKPAAGKPGAGSTGGVHDPPAPLEAGRR